MFASMAPRKRPMFASTVRKNSKCSLIGLYFFEGLTFPGTEFCELAPGKVPNWMKGL
jgi:hypothetical protein